MSEFIEIIGSSEHNLKNINLKIPYNKIIVITGVSGSGKSSLAYDTLYKEGQRRYVESLSSYARQFLGRVKKPEVEHIKGLPPAIAIEQKISNTNPRSTVGTATEIYDYLKLLFARIGKTFSPNTNKEVKKHTAYDISNFILSQPKDTKAFILAPLNIDKTIIEQILKDLLAEGYIRVRIKVHNTTKILKINELLYSDDLLNIEKLWIIIDRIKVKSNEQQTRIIEAAKIAFEKGNGYCIVEINNKDHVFSNRFEEDGVSFIEPTPELFSFTSPLGACPVCKGFGTTIGIAEDLVIPDKNLSIIEGAIAPWRGEKMKRFQQKVIQSVSITKFPIFKPYKDLTAAEKYQLWNERKHFIGINPFFEMLEQKQDKIQYRVMLSRYRAKTVCPACLGTRLRKETRYIKINGKSIQDLVLMQISDLQQFFNNIQLNEYEQQIAKRIIFEIKQRLKYLSDVGLGYLTLNRSMTTLSGGESQRIKLAASLGSSLVGALYVLDEPTIGLHPRDTKRLINVLKGLRDLENTVLIVEHDEEVMRNADQIIDMGPLAGVFGGQIVFQGKFNELLKANTLTAKYLNGSIIVSQPKKRRKHSKGYITIKEAAQNNLKNINLNIPLGLLVAITGVSGSGKSSLIRDVLVAAIEHKLGNFSRTLGDFKEIDFPTEQITDIQFIDQNPVGKSARSNIVTYLKIYDDIRELFAIQPLARNFNFTAKYFSFNVEGGRCPNCAGEGYITIEMQFMADVKIICDVCKGKRFKDEVLEVKFNDKNIYDVLEMTVAEAIEFFKNAKIKYPKEQQLCKKITKNLSVLKQIGLDYIKLGQSSSTYSGGELQRLKLASFLMFSKRTPTLFVFDEPTIGLHFDDVKKLITAFNQLINNGHSVIFIDHNLDLIKAADWIIDLGPEGGNNGGQVIFEGTPEQIIKCQKSYTGKFLKSKF